MGETIPFDRKEGDANAPIEDRIYSNEEVTEIIGTALRNAQANDGSTVNHEEMLNIASEFGLGGADIQRAIDNLADKQSSQGLMEKVVLAFKLHVATCAVFSTALFFINLLTGTEIWWFMYPLVLWGSVVVLHGLIVKFMPAKYWAMMIDEEYEGQGSWRTQIGTPGRAAFYIDDVYGAFAEANGIAEVTDDALVLEFEVKDSIFGALKSKVREEIVPFDEITGVRLQRGMWNSKLTLQGRRLSTFSDVPMADGGEVTLMFQRENRTAVEHLAKELSDRCNR
jgi:hypothetical protein